MPDLIQETLAAVGEHLNDWVTVDRLDPAYRAFFPDGSRLDVIADADRMTAEITRECGRAEADGYQRFVAYAKRLWQLERADFIERNLDSPRDLLTANLLRLLVAGAFGRLQPRINRFFSDPRTRRIFSFQSMYAGLAPHRALAIYAVIAYLDSVAGVFYARGGIHALPTALAAVAAKHGVSFRYDTEALRVEVRNARAEAVITTDGDRVPADVVVLNPDTEAALALLPGQVGNRRMRYSPSCVVVHVGSTQHYGQIAHHNIHFGKPWRLTFDEVIRRGSLMSDPSLLVTNASRDDPTVAPPGGETFYVLAPVPNLRTATQLDWSSGLADRYADDLMWTLEERGYVNLRASTTCRAVVAPSDWAAAGLAAGTPFGAAHTLAQTGPFRPANLHGALGNVVFVGSGTQPGVGIPMVLISGKLAAGRITGARM
jgi:phytoene desaturase